MTLINVTGIGIIIFLLVVVIWLVKPRKKELTTIDILDNWNASNYDYPKNFNKLNKSQI